MKTHCIPHFLPAIVVVLSLLLAGKTALATPKAEHHHDAKGLVGATSNTTVTMTSTTRENTPARSK
jgi:hypothetical protein